MTCKIGVKYIRHLLVFLMCVTSVAQLAMVNMRTHPRLEKILDKKYHQVETNYRGEDQDFITIVYANEEEKTWSLIGIPKDPVSLNLPTGKEFLCYIGSGTSFPRGLLKMDIPYYDGALYPTPDGSRDCQQETIGDKPSCYLLKPFEFFNSLFD